MIELDRGGPWVDHDRSEGDVMLFFYPYRENLTLYIKLKIWSDAMGNDAGVVMSFHEEGKA
jgi:hypothetical protein